MISISTATADPLGHVIIDTNIDIRENTARVARTKTLDGGVYIQNSGFSDGDRTVRVSTRITEEQSATLWYIFSNYTSIHLATPDGLYLAVIKTLKLDNGKMTITILIESKESE